jgi:UDP-glucose 6-dehydrogenase
VGVDRRVLTAVEAANETQKRVLVDKVVARFGEDLQGRRFALWGLAFKPDTDDMREAPSRVIVHELLRRGAAIQAYDPVAMDEARRVFGDLPGMSFASHQADALRDADALLIVTGCVMRGQYIYLWVLLADSRRIVARGRRGREDFQLTVSSDRPVNRAPTACVNRGQYM